MSGSRLKSKEQYLNFGNISICMFNEYQGFFYVSSGASNIATFETSFTQAKPYIHGTPIAELMKEFEADAEKAEMLKTIRMELSQKLDDGDFPLSKLRLSKGFSQAKLAEKMGVTQPHVAKVEKGSGNVEVDTIAKFAEALDTDFVTVATAFYQQRKNRS